MTSFDLSLNVNEFKMPDLYIKPERVMLPDLYIRRERQLPTGIFTYYRTSDSKGFYIKIERVLDADLYSMPERVRMHDLTSKSTELEYA